MYGVVLASLLSANAIFVLIYSAAGVTGNSILTGGFFVVCEVCLLSIAYRRDIEMSSADWFFAAFLVSIIGSLIINGDTAPTKNWVILAVSLASYVCCRFVRSEHLACLKTTYLWIASPIVAIGTVITAYFLILQWNDPHGKPLVFGFDAATNFLGAFGFLLIALVTTPLTPRRRVVLTALLFLPVAIFAAAMVRFYFVAIVVALLLAAVLSSGRQRVYIAIIIATVLAGSTVGLLARFDTAKVLMTYATQETEISTIQKTVASTQQKHNQTEMVEKIVLPSCNLDLDLNNSVAIRKALLRDAFYIIPSAGLFGLGLDSFLTLSCIKGTEVHNTILQSAIEFGWLGALSLLMLIGVAGYRLLPLSKKDDGARFVFCSLAYVTIVSMAHGRVSHDLLLFALIGLGVGIYERDTQKQPAALVSS
ncbi:hypothetical protein ACH79_42455 [Bradyrhizobium sp. CCBAU 051011]|nr:hypothetical protein ACH79_42455 [Bradyrhizobium sp. CCBAU 051011]